MAMVESAPAVAWTAPATVNEKAVVRRGEEAVEFFLAVPEPALFFSFLRELRRQILMFETLWKAFRRFESGDANYSNAQANLDALTREMAKAEQMMSRHSVKFWQFTSLAEKAEEQKRVEKMFGKDGEGFLFFIRDCCEKVTLSEGDQKN